MNRIFHRIAGYLIARSLMTPYFHLPGYMHRYWLSPFPPLHGEPEGTDGCFTAKFLTNPIVWCLQKLDISVRVHAILRSDDGPFYHDHPFSFVSIILRGFYYETFPIYRHGIFVGEGDRCRPEGSVAFRRYDQWHKVILPDTPGDVPEPVYTLFIAFKWRQKWGYLTEPSHKKYYREQHAEAASKLPEIR